MTLLRIIDRINSITYLLILLSLLASTTLLGMMSNTNATWSLAIIPLVLAVVKRPRWSTYLIGLVVIESTKAVAQPFIPGETSMYHLGIGSLVNCAVSITISHLTIENAKLLKRLEKYSFTDELTGSYNRRYYNYHIDRACTQESPLSIILIDIDHFKSINDTHGHSFGDKVLKDTAKTISANIRNGDSLIRIGGEEFVVMLPRTDVEGARKVAERIRLSVYAQEINGVKVTISAGVAQYIDEPGINDIYYRSDQALYLSKDKGRNRVTVDQSA